jgi:hypothetical protein
MNSQSTEDHRVEIVHDGLVTVIKGKKGAGKTTCLLRLFHAHPQGIGFWSRKDWIENELIGYTLVDIVSGESRVLCRLKDLAEGVRPRMISMARLPKVVFYLINMFSTGLWRASCKRLVRRRYGSMKWETLSNRVGALRLSFSMPKRIISL